MISKKYFLADGSTTNFLSDFIIKNDEYCRVYVSDSVELPVSGTARQALLAPVTDWELINNNIVFYDAPEAGKYVTIWVASTPEELDTYVDYAFLTYDNIDDVQTVANNINDIVTAASVVAGIDTVVDNLNEILAADDNAAIATTQAGIATTKASEAAVSAQEAAESAAGINVGDVETKVLAAGQTTVVFTFSTTYGTFYVTGADADNGRLVEDVDYTVNHGTKTVTLNESYPAGTRLVMVYFTGDSAATTATIQQSQVTTTGGETSISVGFDYIVGTNSLMVYRDGTKLRLGADYTEADSYTINLAGGMTVAAGEEWQFVYFARAISGDIVPAANVTNVVSGTTRTLADKLQETVSVKDFGAVGDGVTDDTAAIQAAIDAFNAVRTSNPATLYFPPAQYKVTGTLDFSSTGGKRGEVIGGNGSFEVATIIADYNGYNQTAVFLLGDDSNPSSSQSEICISGFTFEKGASSTYQPVAIVGTRLAQSRISNIRLSSWNNVGLSLATPQNCRFENVTLYSGGNSKMYKDTSGITVSQSGTTVTASSSIFTSSDVGHFISCWGPSPNFTRIKLEVTGFTSGTQVTVAQTGTFSAYDFYFDNPKVSIAASDTELTADASCFTANDVGLTVYVKGAETNGRLLRAKIATYNSPTSVELDTAASTTVSDVDFCTPALEIYTDANASNGGSDNTFINLQIEKHRSVGIVAHDQDILEFVSSKVHSLQSNSSSATFSQSPMWIDRAAGYYRGTFDAQYFGGEKIYAVNQTDCFTFTDLGCRTAYNEILLRVDERATGFEGGIISFDGLSIKGAKSGETVQDLIVDANTSPIGYNLSGKVSYSEYDQTRYYTGNDGSNGWKDIPAPAVSVNWSGTAPSNLTEAAYMWHRVGNIVWFAFRLEYGTVGASNTYCSIEKQADMPNILKPSESSTNEMIMPCDGFIDADLTAPGALCKAYIRDNSGVTEFVAALNSSSISAQAAYVSGFYFTD